MPIAKYAVRPVCLSCNQRISGLTVAVVTTLPEDDHQPRAYLVHERCQSSMLRDVPLADEPKPETETG